jgi:hypothetical protein
MLRSFFFFDKDAKKLFKTKTRSIKSLKSQNPNPLFKTVQQCLFDFKWSSRKVAPGRFHDFEAFEKQNFKLKSYFENQGWTGFLQMKEKLYPRLVQYFYFNAKFSPKTNTLKTMVRDVEIELTPSILSNILGIPNKGNCLFGNKWYTDANTTFEEVSKPLFVPNTKIYDTSHLKILPRIFSIISKFGLLPRKGSYSLLDEEDLIIIHHLFTGQKLNLPHMIIHYMMKVKPRNRKFCVPYGMALTKIFEKFRVPLDGEESEENTSLFGPKNLKHIKP